jgi:fructose-1,6-bisphosphatase II / sedoheptulose-1,7-bisphosphatase
MSLSLNAAPNDESFTMDRNLALEAVRITEAAALASSRWMGKGDEKAADHAAVEAMRGVLSNLDIDGTVVIGEGERDEAPMLYIGEKVGSTNGPQLDIALDPLEGTTTCANGGFNSIAVIAMASKGGFLHAPDVYMDKIAIGRGFKEDLVDLDASPKENLQALAAAKGCEVSDLVVCVLDRPRHEELIARIREAGARILLISDGDITGIIATTKPDAAIDLYMGIGGAPEGVLAAAALRCIGGQMQGRLRFDNEEQRARAKRMGVEDLDKKYRMQELAQGDVMFAATGVTDGPMLTGVRRFATGAETHSIIMRSKTGTVREISARHNFNRKTWVG